MYVQSFDCCEAFELGLSGKTYPHMFCFLAASADLRAPVDRSLTAENNKTDGPHKIFTFLISVDESLPIDSSCLPDENGPKNDIIRTIIKDIT